MIFTTANTDIAGADGAARSRTWRAEHPDTDQARKKSYRHDNSKYETDASYLRRGFVAWDGEGVTHDDGSHHYVMLAAKASDGGTSFQGTPDGLSTVQCFRQILAMAARYPTSIHMIYGGGYDFNMMMRDIPRGDIEQIYRRRYWSWNGFRIGWRRGKSFYLAKLSADHKRTGKGVTIFDVVPFFQCPFVKACDEYLGDAFTNRDMIVANKAARGTFTDSDLATVRQYNDAELDNLIALATELRARLNRAGLRPRRWDGPGAVAAALMLREDIKAARAECPPQVQKAARFAYAGGRFEVLRFGKYCGNAWEYDVNSAYPAALRTVPDLQRGVWKHHRGDPGQHGFALYQVRYRGKNREIPGAFFRRNEKGCISYPMAVEGWYWAPEVAVGREYCRRGNGTMEILSAWVFTPERGATKPFAFIDDMYAKRKVLKAAGDGAHVAIKLGLNSMYGKLAQQVGAEQNDDGTWRIPPFHQLEWAGFVTSWCRARVLELVLDNLSDVIAFETDAVFLSVELPVGDSTELGGWERTQFDNLTYCQSGLYFATCGGKKIAKTRGVDRGSLTRERVEEHLAMPRAVDREVAATLTRFVGAGVALAQSWDRWRRWEVQQKIMTLEPSGKRIHGTCWCHDLVRFPDGLHVTMCPDYSAAKSSEFPVAWINPDPAMTELSELREAEHEWED